MGADFLATGHYARTSRDPQSGRHLLLKGADREKDQSYFLYALSQEQLARALFPLGAMTKDETRRLARSFGLPVSEKPGSQDICFLGEGDYRSLLAERHPESLQPGPIVDTRGRVLGTHKGVAGFTIGQRKSLGIAAGAPLYVVALRPAARTVVVGTKEELQQEKLTVAGINWIAFDAPPDSLEAEVKVRYRQPEQPATIRLIGPPAPKSAGIPRSPPPRRANPPSSTRATSSSAAGSSSDARARTAATSIDMLTLPLHS